MTNWSLKPLVVVGMVAAFVPASASHAARIVPLSSLDLAKMSQGSGRPQADHSVEGKPMSIGGRVFEQGVGTHATSVLHIRTDGKTERFSAFVGVDDETKGHGSVRFKVYADAVVRFDSGVMKGGDEPKRVDVDLSGVKHVVLVAGAAGDNIRDDHADWAEAAFHVAGTVPHAVNPPAEERVILTPKPGPEPRINGPALYGVRPGRPFIYQIPATGQRPMSFAASSLPGSLTLDPKTGIITGNAPLEKGEYLVTLEASNARGRAERPFKIVVGDTIALTPPMGWNSWYIHYHRVSDADMRAAANAMIDSGMANVGYQYVNIDDCWMVKPGSDDPMLGGPPRDADGAIRPNGKFPDMKAMTDYIHAKGLKAGLYTSPGPLTCAGYVGSYQHEAIDARKFAEWGFDFLKYDWCSYRKIAKGNSRKELMKPYKQMGDLLRAGDRDIILNLCQYGMGNVWEWGGDVGGHCWRTTGDLGLAGGQLSIGIYQTGLRNAALSEYARPGRWNDPDYLLIGYVGNAHKRGEGRPTTLTPNEQYTHMSMWCLMAAPLIFSGDMTRLEAFTLNILCNVEVIEVDQDLLGTQARVVRKTDEELILAKKMADGAPALGLFNLAEVEQRITVTWPELGLNAPRIIRDLWRQKDLGEFDGAFSAKIPRHGVALVRLRPAR